MRRGPEESEIQIRLSHCRFDTMDEDMHVCQMQVGVGTPVTRTDHVVPANWETSDEYRSLEAVNAGGRSADSTHMFSQAQPEQNMSFTDMLMAPSDQGICDFYTSASEMQLAYSEHMPMMPSKSQPAQKQSLASQEQQPDTVASGPKLIKKTDSSKSSKGSAASQQNPAGRDKWTEAEEQWVSHPPTS